MNWQELSTASPTHTAMAISDVLDQGNVEEARRGLDVLAKALSRAERSDGALRWKRRRGVRLATVMVVILVSGVLMAWVAAERQRRVNLLNGNLQVAEERLAWAEKMSELGYVTKSQLTADRVARDDLKSRLRMLGARVEKR